MSIKIIASNIELDFVRETLTIKNENNSLSRDFKVSASVIPFLIIENQKTKLALGTRDLSSIKKKKVFDVVVLDGDSKFFGELEVLSYLNGFRKCNLRYSSVILSIMSRKIGEFMPTISVIPDEVNPVDYSEKSDSTIVGSEYWQSYPLPFLGKVFPEVKWQFPTMKWLNKFGVNLEADDPWYLYKDEINQYDAEGLIENYFTIIGDECKTYNKNVVAPQVFLLSPAFYALQFIGYSLKGNFIESEFIKRILLLSTKNNLTETKPVKDQETITMPPLVLYDYFDEDGTTVLYKFYYAIKIINTPVAGTYIFDYDLLEPSYEPVDGFIDRKMFQIFLSSEPIYTVYTQYQNSPAQHYQGTVKIEISEDQVGTNIYVRYYSPIDTYPSYLVKKTIGFTNVYYQMHPTIKLGRYLPDWTFGTYLNELQNLFNLEITPNDIEKTLTLNFNEESIAKSDTYISKKSLLLSSYDPPKSDAFLLKYENEVDDALWITTDSVELYDQQKSNFSETLSSKFKYVPVTYTANLSEDVEGKNGAGLMIYDPTNKPNISADYLGQTLQISGAKGIYNVFWKVFLKFLFNSSSVELIGAFTETEKNKIGRFKRIFIDNQEYLIASTEITETKQNNYKIKFSLQTVTF